MIDMREMTKEEFVQHFQELLDSGEVWDMGPVYYVIAKALIERGIINERD